MNTWQRRGKGKAWHVYPISHGHVTDGHPCWCGPRRSFPLGQEEILVHSNTLFLDSEIEP